MNNHKHLSTHAISLTCVSFIILVTSGWILLAMPKSINFNEAFTMTKFAGFKSLWTIPARKSYERVKPSKYNRETLMSLESKPTVFVDGLHRLQHVRPVELPLQGIHSFAVSQPCVQIQVTTLHQHIDVAVGYLTINAFIGRLVCQLKKKKENLKYYIRTAN